MAFFGRVEACPNMSIISTTFTGRFHRLGIKSLFLLFLKFFFKLGFIFQEFVLPIYLGSNTLVALLSELKMKNVFTYFYR